MIKKLMSTPRSVDLEITSRCNIRCRYCYYLNNEGVEYQDLPTEKWLQFFDELGEAKVLDVCLAGGEPLVREDIFKLIGGIVKNRMRFQVLTNGILITRETAVRLRETSRCNSVQVSLDGSRAEIHESLRGKGSFQPALDAIKILKEEKIPVTVRVTVHPYNIDDLPTVAHLLLEEINIPSFSTNSASSLGTHAKYQDDILLTPVDRLRAMKVLAGLDEKYPGRILASAGPLANWKMFREMEAARKKNKPIPGRGHLVGCGCTFNNIAVRADGAFIPCVMLPQMVLGHINRDSLREIWINSSQLKSLRERRTIPLERFTECQGCEYLNLCTGNCAGGSLSLLGDANQPSPADCLRKFKKDLAAKGLSLC